MDEQNGQQPQPTNTGGFTPSTPAQVPNQFQPQQFQSFNQTQPASPFSPMQPARSGGKLKFVLVGVFLSVLLLGGGAAAYMQFVVNSPEKIWERALSNTSKGLDSVVSTQSEQWPGSKMEANFSVSSPIATDGSMKGSFHGSSGSATFDVGAAGLRVNGEMRMIGVDNSTTPDIYMKVDGVDSIMNLLSDFTGQPTEASSEKLISEIDNQWFSVDHTLIDQLLASGGAAATPEITEEDMQKIATTVSRVTSERLLATNEKAVFTVLEEVGKEDFEGSETFKFKVGVDKENLKSFLNEMKSALKDTKFSELITTGQSQSYDEIANLEEIMKEIDKVDMSKAKADVWVEPNGKFVRNVRIYDNNDETAKSFFDIGMPYKGGDIIPIQVKVTLDDDGLKGAVTVGFDMHKQGSSLKVWTDVSVESEGTKVTGKGEFTAERSDEKTDVSKPEGARNIYDLLGIFSSAQPTGFDDSLLYQEDDFGQSLPGSDSEFLDDFEL